MDGPQGPGTLPWEERMNKTFDLIFKALSENKLVLLHCKGGRHRAGVVAGCSLAIVHDLTWHRGMEMVIDKRSNVYSDFDRKIVREIADYLELHQYVTEYSHTDGWAKFASFFRGDDDTEARS